MRKSIGIFIIIGFLAVVTPVLAQMSDKCLDNVTLQRNINYTFRTDINAKNLTITKNEDCQFGCDNVTNTCAPNPVDKNFMYGGVVMGVMVLLGLITMFFRRIGG